MPLWQNSGQNLANYIPDFEAMYIVCAVIAFCSLFFGLSQVSVVFVSSQIARHQRGNDEWSGGFRTLAQWFDATVDRSRSIGTSEEACAKRHRRRVILLLYIGYY